jgi:hypothetical protein
MSYLPDRCIQNNFGMETSVDSVPLTRLNLNMNTLFAFRVSSFPPYCFQADGISSAFEDCFYDDENTVIHDKLSVTAINRRASSIASQISIDDEDHFI